MKEDGKRWSGVIKKRKTVRPRYTKGISGLRENRSQMSAKKPEDKMFTTLVHLVFQMSARNTACWLYIERNSSRRGRIYDNDDMINNQL